ncbi:hypothetical protein KCU73_g150, partial [Aureobasidium melanogenum]
MYLYSKLVPSAISSLAPNVGAPALCGIARVARFCFDLKYDTAVASHVAVAMVEVELLMCMLTFILGIPHLRCISKILLNRKTEVPNAELSPQDVWQLVWPSGLPIGWWVFRFLITKGEYATAREQKAAGRTAVFHIIAGHETG